jgi:hypothetical protein
MSNIQLNAEDQAFVVSHFKSTRAIIANIGSITQDRLEKSVVGSQSVGVTYRDQAKLAWESLAWYKFFGVTLSKSLENKLWDRIIKDEASLYLASIYLVVEPNEGIREKLSSLNGPIVKQYDDYCQKYLKISQVMGFPLGEAFGLTKNASPF